MRIGLNLIQYTDVQGIEIFAQNIINHLPDDPKLEFILFTNQKSAEIFFKHQRNIKIVTKNFSRLNKLNLILYQQWGLLKKLRQEKIDLLFCPSIACPLFYKKKIVSIHDLAIYRLPMESPWLARCYFQLSLWSAKYFSLGVATVSEFSKREIQDILRIKETKIIILSEGVPAMATATPEQEKEILNKFFGDIRINYFIYIGNIRPRKNLPNIVKAWSLFLSKQPNYQLIIAGKLDKRAQQLQEFIKHQSLEKQITFTGFLSDREKTVLLQNSRGLIFPSLYEGFGLPVLEAQSLNVPVLTSNYSALPEVAGEGALLVDPENVDDIKNGLEQLAGNEELRQKLIRKGAKNSQRYSWQKAVDGLMNFLKSYENTPNQ